jgi:hypothetical protein
MIRRFKKVGNAIGELYGKLRQLKLSKKLDNDAVKFAEKTTDEAFEKIKAKKDIIGDTLPKKKSTLTKIAAGTAVVGVTITAVTAANAIKSFDARDNKPFIVNKIERNLEEKDEIVLTISNSNKLCLYPKETILFENPNVDVLRTKAASGIIKLKSSSTPIPYNIISTDPYGEDPDSGVDYIPTKIIIKIPGLDVTGRDKDMLIEGSNLITIVLQADPTNDIQESMDGTGNFFIKTGEAIVDPFEKFIEILKNVGIYGGIGIAALFITFLLYKLITYLILINKSLKT